MTDIPKADSSAKTSPPGQTQHASRDWELTGRSSMNDVPEAADVSSGSCNTTVTTPEVTMTVPAVNGEGDDQSIINDP